MAKRPFDWSFFSVDPSIGEAVAKSKRGPIDLPCVMRAACLSKEALSHLSDYREPKTTLAALRIASECWGDSEIAIQRVKMALVRFPVTPSAISSYEDGESMYEFSSGKSLRQLMTFDRGVGCWIAARLLSESRTILGRGDVRDLMDAVSIVLAAYNTPEYETVLNRYRSLMTTADDILRRVNEFYEDVSFPRPGSQVTQDARLDLDAMTMTMFAPSLLSSARESSVIGFSDAYAELHAMSEVKPEINGDWDSYDEEISSILTDDLPKKISESIDAYSTDRLLRRW